MTSASHGERRDVRVSGRVLTASGRVETKSNRLKRAGLIKIWDNRKEEMVEFL